MTVFCAHFRRKCWDEHHFLMNYLFCLIVYTRKSNFSSIWRLIFLIINSYSCCWLSKRYLDIEMDLMYFIRKHMRWDFKLLWVNHSLFQYNCTSDIGLTDRLWCQRNIFMRPGKTDCPYNDSLIIEGYGHNQLSGETNHKLFDCCRHIYIERERSTKGFRESSWECFLF
jgi:hypothetical protein